MRPITLAPPFEQRIENAIARGVSFSFFFVWIHQDLLGLAKIRNRFHRPRLVPPGYNQSSQDSRVFAVIC